ncbi:response regulator transcription factor [Amycolatopsis acidicola]|uniref:Response regulator transcription factor n=1 Tax=Amycolatopsis acidicola TaxID=2596893 RepID=A0A5N0UMA1_9PSEU|nr:response regulator transcription factor [Amycolatopsis acidicola]KAA9148577.1 response regulator transcription factor [Amycolatopsis acidicola]
MTSIEGAEDAERVGPITVLIADDQETVRRNLRRILEADGLVRVVAEAVDGVEAIELAQELRPDVVLADIRMPRRDGLAVTRALAGPGAENPLRVVVITTFDLDEYVYAALRNGACGFLLKRSGPTLLIEGVRAAMAGDVLVSPQVTVRLLQHLARHSASSRPWKPLTEREFAVACMVADAKTNPEIAAELSITVGTVKTHVSTIQRKLRARNRVAIAAWAWGTDSKAREAG